MGGGLTPLRVDTEELPDRVTRERWLRVKVESAIWVYETALSVDMYVRFLAHFLKVSALLR